MNIPVIVQLAPGKVGRANSTAGKALHPGKVSGSAEEYRRRVQEWMAKGARSADPLEINVKQVKGKMFGFSDDTEINVEIPAGVFEFRPASPVTLSGVDDANPLASIRTRTSQVRNQVRKMSVGHVSVTDKKDALSPLRRAWLEKAAAALERLCASASDELLASSLTKREPVESLIEVMAASQSLALSAPNDAMLDSIKYMDDLVKRANGVIGSTGAAALLKISRQALDKRRRQGRLIAIKSKGDWGYPFCQFQNGEVLNGLESILKSRSAQDPYVTLDFLLAPEAELGDVSIIEALRAGGDLAKEAIALAHAAEGDQYA